MHNNTYTGVAKGTKQKQKQKRGKVDWNLQKPHPSHNIVQFTGHVVKRLFDPPIPDPIPTDEDKEEEKNKNKEDDKTGVNVQITSTTTPKARSFPGGRIVPSISLADTFLRILPGTDRPEVIPFSEFAGAEGEGEAKDKDKDKEEMSDFNGGGDSSMNGYVYSASAGT